MIAPEKRAAERGTDGIQPLLGQRIHDQRRTSHEPGIIGSDAAGQPLPHREEEKKREVLLIVRRALYPGFIDTLLASPIRRIF